MKIQPRSRRSRFILISYVAVASCFLVVMVISRQYAASVAAAVTALMLILISLRRKAPCLPDALYCASTDMVVGRGKQHPGQLSITATGLTWNPSTHSRQRGYEIWSVSIAEISGIVVERAPSLLSVLVVVRNRSGETRTFVTRGGRNFRLALDGLQKSIKSANSPWRWENRRVTPAIVEDARRILETGGTRDDALHYLRDHGANAIDTIIFLRKTYGMSAKDAQIILHSSEAWPELHGR